MPAKTVGFESLAINTRTCLSISTEEWAPLRHSSGTDGTGAPHIRAMPATPLYRDMARMPTCMMGSSLGTISDGVVITMG